MITFPALASAQGTFMSLPEGIAEGDHPEIGIIGVGFDVGTHPFRIGARQGPDHIRAQSVLLREHLADRPASGLNNVVDLGNVRLTPGRIDTLIEQGTAAVSAVVERGIKPLGLGGDGTATLPLLKALHAVHGPLAVVHFDAHTDAYPCSDDERLNTATTFTVAAEEGLIDPARSIHLGVRGTTFHPDVIGYGRELGFSIQTTDELLEHTSANLTHLLRERTRQSPTYLCWDMDVFDPAVAPGVATPEWGGLNAREGIRLARSFAHLNIVGADVGTVSPPHDLGGMTGLLAARMVLEMIYSMQGDTE